MLDELERMTREDLIAYARQLGITRPELLTRVELKDEILRVSESDDVQRRKVRGWFGVARDLLASVVEQGLHLPDAAALIRGGTVELQTSNPRVVATVTLAEIYSTQGHVRRALGMLEEVLVSEPEHEAARALRERLLQQTTARSAEPVSGSHLQAADSPSPAVVGRPELHEEPTEAVEADAAQSDTSPLAASDASFEVAFSEHEMHTGEQFITEEPDLITAEWRLAERFARRTSRRAEELDSLHELSGREDMRDDSENAPDSGVHRAEVPLASDAAADLFEMAAAEEPMPVGAAAPEALPRESARASDVSPPLLPKGLDALILIREAGRLFAYWQIDENTYARAQKRRPGGRLTLKFVSLRPTWDGALRQEFEMDLAERQGFAAIDSAPFAGALRAVVGLADASGFRPFAIAEELRSIEGSAEPELHRHSLRRRRTTEHEASLRALCRWAFEQMQTLP